MVATGRRENLVWIVEAGSSSLQSYRGKYQLWEEKGGIILMYGGIKGSKAGEAVWMGAGDAGGYLSSYIIRPKHLGY